MNVFFLLFLNYSLVVYISIIHTLEKGCCILQAKVEHVRRGSSLCSMDMDLWGLTAFGCLLSPPAAWFSSAHGVLRSLSARHPTVVTVRELGTAETWGFQAVAWGGEWGRLTAWPPYLVWGRRCAGLGAMSVFSGTLFSVISVLMSYKWYTKSEMKWFVVKVLASVDT